MRLRFRFLILVVCFSFVLFGMENVFALGVSPARTTVAFESGFSRAVSFDVFNQEGKDMNLVLTVDGELAPYISFDSQEVFLSSEDSSKSLNYYVNIPDNLEPGTRTARVIITEMPEESSSELSYVSATLAVATQFYVNVPFPGKYASSGFVVYNVDTGEEVTFVFPVTCLGEFDLTSVRANIDIYNSANEIIDSLNTKSISIPSGDRRELVYKWDGNLSVGEYYAKAVLIYDEGTLNLESSFSVGSKELVLQDISVNDFSLGDIVKLEMLVENKWSEEISDAYIETKIMDSDGDAVAVFKSSSYSVGALDKEVFSSYWDTAGVKSGTYEADVSIYYGEKVSRNNLEFEVGENEFRVIGLGYVISSEEDDDNNLIVVLVIVIVVLVLINLLWFLILRKRLGGKK